MRESSTSGTPATRTEPRAQPSRWAALAAICVGTMMAFVNVSSTIGALTGIQADLDASMTQVVWITSAYSLAVATLILAAGTLADIVGRRAVFLAGAALFVVGSICAFAASSSAALIAAQAIMGIGGAMVLPSGLAVVGGLFSSPKERTEAVSIWAGSSGLGLAIGPLVAGLLLEHFSWHSVFVINIALGLIVIVATLRCVPESRHAGKRLDPVGIVLGTIGVGALTFGIIEGKPHGYASPTILGCFAVALIATVAFAFFEARHPDPMIDVRLFRKASFSAVMLVATVTMFGFTGTALLTVLYLQHAQGLSALGAAVRTLAMFVPFILVSPLAAKAAHRLGFKALMGIGLVVMSTGMFLLLLSRPARDFAHLWPGLLLVGVAAGLLIAPSTAAAMNSVPPRQAGMASAAVNMFRQLGNVLGASVLGTILTSGFASHLATRLDDAGLPPDAVDEVVRGAEHGSGTQSLPAALESVVADAVTHAFTQAFHIGMVIAAITVLAVAIPTVVFVKSSPSHASDE